MSICFDICDDEIQFQTQGHPSESMNHCLQSDQEQYSQNIHLGDQANATTSNSPSCFQHSSSKNLPKAKFNETPLYFYENISQQFNRDESQESLPNEDFFEPKIEARKMKFAFLQTSGIKLNLTQNIYQQQEQSKIKLQQDKSKKISKRKATTTEPKITKIKVERKKVVRERIPGNEKCCSKCNYTYFFQEQLGGHMSKRHPGQSTVYKKKVETRRIRAPARKLREIRDKHVKTMFQNMLKGYKQYIVDENLQSF